MSEVNFESDLVKQMKFGLRKARCDYPLSYEEFKQLSLADQIKYINETRAHLGPEHLEKLKKILFDISWPE